MQSLQIAGQLEGGLTRSNLMTATEAFDMTNPMLLPGIRLDLDGNDDAYFTEGSELSRYDAARQTWAQQGDVIDVSGRSLPCAFDAATGVCR